MTESEVRRYLGEMLPALADIADAIEAPDLGEAAVALRLMAHKLSPAQTVPNLAQVDLHLVS